jgi:hypothetical protein
MNGTPFQISCPSCRSVLQPAEAPPTGDFRLACPVCAHVFQVSATPETPEELPEAEPVAPPEPEAAGYGEAWICEPRAEFSARLDKALRNIGFIPRIVKNGGELAPGQSYPKLALVSSYLLAEPGGLWQRLTTATPRPRLVLLGEIHNIHRYRRNPAQLYGADAYLEELEEDGPLETALREQLGLSAPAAEPQASPAAMTLARQLFSDLIMQHSESLSAMDGPAAREFCAADLAYNRQLLEQRYPGNGPLLEGIFNDYLRLKN